MKCEQQLRTPVDRESCGPPLVDGYYFTFIGFPPTMTMDSVGGHAGIQTTEDGSLLLEPALSRELVFYQLVRDGLSPDIDAATATASALTPLLPWIPKSLGVLSLSNHLVENLPEMTAVHNLPAFVRVNGAMIAIALEKKKEHMIRTAASTTSLSTGMRLTGFQTYFQKEYMASSVPPSDDVVTMPDDIQQGFPPRTLLVLLTRLLESLECLCAALATAKVRIVGGSIPTIYEGDWASAEEAARISLY
ncbi:hypothetical protein EDD15DRAFT_2202363 [Pisolithus albus]|nr:hypothetical protein EDD15DRAFT_2202363 [Pisolithus albus]